MNDEGKGGREKRVVGEVRVRLAVGKAAVIKIPKSCYSCPSFWKDYGHLVLIDITQRHSFLIKV